MKSKKPNYYPATYPIRHHDRTVLVDEERAVKFMEFRARLCDALGADHDLCNPTNLMRLAIDRLMAFEGALLTKVDGKHFEFEGMLKFISDEEEE